MQRLAAHVLSGLAIALAAGWAANPAPAAIVKTVTPVADTFVSAANPASSYGAAGALAISAPSLAKGEFQSLLRFDLAAVKADLDAAFGGGNWQVSAVSLTLTAIPPANALFNGNAAGPGGSNVNAAGSLNAAWMSNEAWLEGTGTPNAPGASGLTLNSLPTFVSATDQPLGTLSFSGSTTAQSTYPLQLASGLLGDIDTGGLASIRLSAADAQVSALFDSRNFSSASAWPTLSLTAVPEPASLLLLALGMAALLASHRRKNGHTSQ